MASGGAGLRVCSDRIPQLDMDFLRKFDGPADRMETEAHYWYEDVQQQPAYSLFRNSLYVDDILQDTYIQRAKRLQLRCEIEVLAKDPAGTLWNLYIEPRDFEALLVKLSTTRDIPIMIYLFANYRTWSLVKMTKRWVGQLRTENDLVQYIAKLISIGVALTTLIQIEVRYAISLGENDFISDDDPLPEEDMGLPSYESLEYMQCSPKMRYCVIIWRRLSWFKLVIDNSLAGALGMWPGHDISDVIPTAHDYLRVTSKDCQAAYWQGSRRLPELTICHFAGANDRNRVYEVANLHKDCESEQRKRDKSSPNNHMLHQMMWKRLEETARQYRRAENSTMILQEIKNVVEHFTELYASNPLLQQCCKSWTRNLTNEPDLTDDLRLEAIRRTILSLQLDRHDDLHRVDKCYSNYEKCVWHVVMQGGYEAWI